jgi:peptidoglycan/xylan/chitin deacetylase (PgdA/CDA1 family)
MPLIWNKRAVLARALRASGLLALVERLARRPGLLVVTYHRVGDPSGHPFYPGVASATPEGLSDELRTLARSRRVVALEEAVALAEDGFRTTEPLAMVAFDDGYRDNADAAVPVLRSLGLPAAFFLTTGFVSGEILPWWDHVAYVVNAAAVPVLKLDRPEPLEIDLARAPRAEAVARVVRAYLDHPEADERALRPALEERAGVAVDEPRLARSLFLDWGQARALAAAGVAVGSHTVTHRALGRLSEDEQRAELVESRRRIEAEVGREVSALAYPYGWPGAFDATTARLARAAGYRAAFSARPGVNLPGAADPFAARRLNVGFADPPVLHRARWALHGAFGRSAL